MILRPPYVLSSLSHLYHRSCNALVSLMFPLSCPGCSVLLRYPDAICPSCATGLKKIIEPMCRRCGTPFPARWTVKQCAGCSTRRSALTRIRSVYSYEGLARKMIRAAKYHGQPRCLRFFAEQLFVTGRFFRRLDAVVPVPLHRKREWVRRFNQSEILAREYSRLSGVSVWRGLRKRNATVAQSSLSGVARKMNLKDAFVCRNDFLVPRSVLLIDDVITTGATVEECARALRRNGAKRVYAVSIARALKHF